MTLNEDAYYMSLALKQAERALEEEEIPVGAVVVCQGKIVAKAYNQTEMLTDVTAHAEMLAITSAAQTVGAKYLKGTKYGIWGNYIGLIIGLFTPVPFGFLIFSFLGALAGELLYDHKDFKRALSAAIGTLIGFLVSVVLNTGIALVMLIVFLYFVISNWSAIF